MPIQNIPMLCPNYFAITKVVNFYDLKAFWAEVKGPEDGKSHRIEFLFFLLRRFNGIVFHSFMITTSSGLNYFGVFIRGMLCLKLWK